MSNQCLKSDKNKFSLKNLKDNFLDMKEKCKKNKLSDVNSTKLNTFSMIKFYESIPEYDEISHLPAYDFSERLNSLKKIHFDISENKYFGSGGRCKRVKTPKKKKRKSGRKSSSKSSNGSHSALDSANCRSPTEIDDFSSCKRSSSSNSHNSIGFRKNLKSIRSKILAEIDVNEKKAVKNDNENTLKPYKTLPSNLSILKSDKVVKTNSRTQSHHHHHHHFHSPHPHHHHHHLLPHTHEEHYHHQLIPHHHHHDLHFKDINKPAITLDCPTIKSPVTNDKKNTNDQCKIKTLRRSKSCPKNLFSNYFTPDFNKYAKKRPPSVQTVSPQPCDDEKTLQLEIDRIVNGNRRNINRHVKHKKSPSLSSASRKPVNKMDDFLPTATQIVRSNLAANLREQWSRKKITLVANERLKTTQDPSQFIPKCHRWNVRQSPGWKSFVMEDTKTEKLMRQAARNEEQLLRQQAHTIGMKLMRSRVRSAQLLLEGRALSAK